MVKENKDLDDAVMLQHSINDSHDGEGWQHHPSLGEDFGVDLDRLSWLYVTRVWPFVLPDGLVLASVMLASVMLVSDTWLLGLALTVFRVQYPDVQV
jgi:hypothetical protein